MKEIKLSKNEIRALKELLETNACESGCVYNEMVKSRKDCDECNFTKAVQSIMNKINE